ncbi:MAG TPA: hypothetical protein PKD45_14275, partial [Flavobacteriales bacterium]|nr:hypothetical protein [Flavobacteriales bacterium]
SEGSRSRRASQPSRHHPGIHRNPDPEGITARSERSKRRIPIPKGIAANPKIPIFILQNPMAMSTYTKIHYHVVFATLNREPCLDRKWREQLWAGFNS